RLSRRRRWRNSVEITRRPATRSFTLPARIHNWVRCSDIPSSKGKAVRGEITSQWSKRLIVRRTEQRLAAMALRLLGHTELTAHRSNGGFDQAVSTDGNHRYSRTKNKRSPFVSWTRPRTLRCSTI